MPINISYCRTENVIDALDEWLNKGAGDMTKGNLEQLKKLCAYVVIECEERLEAQA